MASQVTVYLNIAGGNRFDLAIEKVEERVVSPGVPPLVQGNWAEVDDVGQGAIGAGAEGQVAITLLPHPLYHTA